MAWYNDSNEGTLNFMVIGNCFSGHQLLRDSLSRHPDVICHSNLLNRIELVRRQSHESYFGSIEKVPDWFNPQLLSAEQYLSNKIFDNNLNGESAVGVILDYEDIVDYDLWDYIDRQCKLGDFCVIHVVRNPVACYVDKMSTNAENGKKKKRVRIQAANLTAFVGSNVATTIKINRLCDDLAIVPYHRLVLDFKNTMTKMLQFLELEENQNCVEEGAYGSFNSVKSRIINRDDLADRLSLDVLEFFNSSDLF